MKRLLALLLLCLALPLCAAAAETEAPRFVVDLTANPEATYAFQEGVPLLEVYFPPVTGADACLLRYEDKTMLVDAATIGQAPLVMDMLAQLGVDHLDYAFNTHPHDDHITGFQLLPEEVTVGKLLLAFPEDENLSMRDTLQTLRPRNIPIEQVANGDVIMLGDVKLVIMQRTYRSWGMNDRSAAAMVFYGDRRLLLAADIELRTQGNWIKYPPEFGLKADILKYPHHGVAKAGWNFLKHVDAELAVVTNSLRRVEETVKDSEKRGLPLVSTEEGILRLRTDGSIWVVDRIAP